MSPRILVVEDERAIALALSGLLRKEGCEVITCVSHAEAVRHLADGVDLVITDLSLGKGPGGMDVLRSVKEVRPDTPVVVITAHGSEKVAVAAMKEGAEDYVPKPFENDEIRLLVRRVLDRTRLVREHRMLQERMEREYGSGTILGSGPAMRRVLDTISRVSDTDLSVLVRGESGSGKELVAQALHQRSERRQRPFVAINCAAISRELVESELFGHEKGAFTGANTRRIGKFEAAASGTLFLDEIGDMPLETQAKVLRSLEEKTIERVGGNRPIEVDVRVVAATHRDLEEEVRRGRFREDLYYRLQVVEITLPPLRERIEDVPLLAEKFLQKSAERLGRERRHLGQSALSALVRHSWPGNARELRNVLERASVLAEGLSIEAADLRLDRGAIPEQNRGAIPEQNRGAIPEQNRGAIPEQNRGAIPEQNRGAIPEQTMAGPMVLALPFPEAKRRAVEDFERRYLGQALRENGGNVSRTAEAIGVVRQSLQQKLRELGIKASDS